MIRVDYTRRRGGSSAFRRRAMLGRAVTVFLLVAFPRSFAGAAPPVAPPVS
jgi:hypothetical protein